MWETQTALMDAEAVGLGVDPTAFPGREEVLSRQQGARNLPLVSSTFSSGIPHVTGLFMAPGSQTPSWLALQSADLLLSCAHYTFTESHVHWKPPTVLKAPTSTGVVFDCFPPLRSARDQIYLSRSFLFPAHLQDFLMCLAAAPLGGRGVQSPGSGWIRDFLDVVPAMLRTNTHIEVLHYTAQA